MTTTFNMKNRTFVTAAGRNATVWSTKEVGSNVTGMRGFGRTVRTFVTVEGDAREFDCDVGCSFQAERVVARA